MHKKLLKDLCLIVLTLSFFGCSSAKNVKVRSYIEDRPRVDQELSGNAGYLAGSGSKQQPGKPTRKVFVVEIDKQTDPNAIPDIKTDVGSSSKSEESSAADLNQNVSPHINLPTFREEAPKTAEDIKNKVTNENADFIEYVVEKDDTLQKLSKKFYNSYSKWTKIYEANKSVLKNPDFIKPGITIKIPTEK